MEKTCRDCSLLKKEEEFQRKKSMKDGRDSYCKPCKRIRQTGYLEVHLSDPKKMISYKMSQTKWARENPLKAKNARHNSWLKLRNDMLDNYGRECACCGVGHVQFLTLEHVNRDGSAHRLLVGGGTNTYRDLHKKGWPREGYKVLCMNCNWAIRRGGECPHKTQLSGLL